MSWRRFSAAAALALAACAQNPVTGRSEFLVVSEEQAIASSAEAYGAMLADFNRKRQVESGTARARRVQEIAARLIAEAKRLRPDAAAWNWEITLIDEPKTVNAFAMAGGKMAIYTGVWNKLGASEDEVAQILGHEIAHAVASDTRERMSIAMGVGVATAVAGAAVASRHPEHRDLALSGLAAAAALAITLPNSRQSESDADRIGIELAARAGFDPRAAVTLWEKMGREGGAPPEFLSTHPSPENRRQRLQALAVELEPVYRAAKAKS